MEENKIITPEIVGLEEEKLEKTLRPQTLDEYIGQDKVKDNMKVLFMFCRKKDVYCV